MKMIECPTCKRSTLNVPLTLIDDSIVSNVTTQLLTCPSCKDNFERYIKYNNLSLIESDSLFELQEDGHTLIKVG